jgi:drug/metabolite transporter (DMT)-like permease
VNQVLIQYETRLIMLEPLFSSLIALFVAFLWGVNSHLVKKGMIGENTFSGLFYRSVSAFPILIILGLFVSGLDVLLSYFSLAIFPIILFSAIMVAFGDAIFAYSLTKYPVKVILPITSVYPLFASVLLIVLGQEDISIQILVGTVIIVIGVYLVTRGDGKDKIKKEAIIYGIFPAMAWGSSVVMVRYVLATSPGAESISLTGLRVFFIGVIGLAMFLLSNRKLKDYFDRPRKEKVNSIVFLGLSGIIGWTIGATLFFFAVQNIGAGIPTPISSTNPIWAVIIGSILGIEYITKKQSTGVLFCVIGTITILL